MNEILINTEKDSLDLNFIHQFISNSYWGKGRTIDVMKACIENSLNFGIYINNKQIGYARLVTDYTQFAYIMDLFIDGSYRGKGYAKELMKYITELESLQNVKVWRLATNDAHNLYKQFGFKKLANPDNLMEKIR